MVGLVPLAGLLLAANAVELDASAIAEMRGGQAPLVANRPPTAGFVSVLTPGAELSVRDSNLEMRLDYGPRIFWRRPNLASRDRPLVLHLANLSLATRLTPTVSVTSGASLSAGEADYTLLPQLVGTVQATLPAVANLLVATGRAGLDVQVTRSTRLGLALEASYRRPIGDVDAESLAGSLFLQRQTGVQAAPNATVRISRLDDLLFATPVAYRSFERGANFLSVTPQAGWRRRLSPTDEVRLSGGVTYSRATYDATVATPGTRSTVAPVGSVEMLRLFLRRQGLALQGAVGAMADYYVDPILVVPQKRITTTARFLLSLGDRWTAGIEAALGSTLDPVPPIPGSTIPPDATYAAVSVPIRYRFAEGAYLEFGGQWSDRAPHTESSRFDFHQRQLWVYTLLSLTTRETPRWVLPDGGDRDRRRRSPPARTEAEAGTGTARITARAVDRISGTTQTDTGLPLPGDGPPAMAEPDSMGGLPRQPSADRRSTDEEDESESQRERELPNESQLPIGIGGVR